MRTILDHEMQLHDFLSKYGPQLRGVRAFYIVEPRLDRGKIVKFGVAGMDSGNAFDRLRSYDIAYGRKGKENDCLGVIIHYCGIVTYNRNVEKRNTEIWKLEHHLKIKYNTKSDSERGEERVSKTKLHEIKNYIRTQRFVDSETIRRPGLRASTVNVRVDDKTSHKPGDKPKPIPRLLRSKA
jgi:hypothetical protein